jgi:hypothetical protein
MPRLNKQRPARCRRVPQQIDLFAVGLSTIGDVPTWSGLPTETQVALTTLMTRLILDHADKRRIESAGDGHDL